MESFKRILQFIIDAYIVVGFAFIVYFITKPLVGRLCDWRIRAVRAKADRRVNEIMMRYEGDRMFVMDRMPHFRKIGDEWYVRGPLEALGGQTSVTVRRKDQSEVVVDVDPDTLTPVSKEDRTQWDGRKPHTVKVVKRDDSPDWTL